MNSVSHYHNGVKNLTETIYSVFKENYEKFDKDKDPEEYEKLHDFIYFIETYLSNSKILGKSLIEQPCYYDIKLASGSFVFMGIESSCFAEKKLTEFPNRGVFLIKSFTPCGLRLVTKNWNMEFNFK